MNDERARFPHGTSNTNGANNTFIGVGSGILNTDGGDNSFVGAGAGQSNDIGQRNSFFGRSAGASNTADNNSFFGANAGIANTTGSGNVFVGGGAGATNNSGAFNTFVGVDAGSNNARGQANVIVGASAGLGNTVGTNNTLLGSGADVRPAGGVSPVNMTAVGSNATVSKENSLVLGSINGVGNGIADTSVGIGTPTPKARLDVTGGNILVGSPGQGIILKSPDGLTCKLFSIDNAGALALASVPCP